MHTNSCTGGITGPSVSITMLNYVPNRNLAYSAVIILYRAMRQNFDKDKFKVTMIIV